ncbi:MAG: zinc ribbon domain-containing protein [Terracidiphilus sp.]|jgi:hypothetical protein
MIERLEYHDDCVFVHVAQTSLKTTMAFTHGSLVFDTNARTSVFARLPPVAVPEEIVLREGETLNFQLVGPDGELRKQRRSGVLTADKKQSGILRIGGMAQTPRRFKPEDGWRNEIYKYRAYFSHPGITSTVEEKFERFEQLPEWLRGCIGRQKELWNRLAWLCREARRKCSPAPAAEIAEFVANTILPEIDAFNLMLGRNRSKEKMRHPAKLKIEMPGADGLWSFVGELRGRIEKKRAVPEGLLEEVVEFAQQFKADYTPLNEFLDDFQAIAEREAVALGLRRFEIRPTVSAFKAVLNRRKTIKASWSEGWPLLKFPESPKAGNWGVHYYFNKAGVDSLLLEIGNGVSGLSFGPPRPARETGYEKMHSKRRTARKMREALISIPDGMNKTRHELRFAVLEHRPLPLNSHLKEWKLIYQDGKLWLCLVVELQRPLASPAELAAGLEIGWRRTEEGIRFGTLYEPVTNTVHELTIDLKCSPSDHRDRRPFFIDLGPNRWQKRVFERLTSGMDAKACPNYATSIKGKELYRGDFPDWNPGEAIPGLMEIRNALQVRRDHLKDTAKTRLRKHLGERAPAWLDKAGRNGLYQIGVLFPEDGEVQAILQEWMPNDERIGGFLAEFNPRVTQRIEYGQQQVAHDLCRYLQSKKIGCLVVESKFLAKVSQQRDNEDRESLKRSQKYRQFAAPGKFIAVLKNTAVKYGIAVEEHESVNISRKCHYCDCLNPATEREKYNCGGCGRVVRQDHNAAINLSRFGGGAEEGRATQPASAA